MRVRSRRLGRLAPGLALVAAGGCFATRNDVKLVQTDIAALRTEVARQQDDLKAGLAQANRLLQVASDSLAHVSTRTVSIQGDVRGEMRSIKDQLLQIQQLLGQSQATIARLRSEVAERAAAPPPTVPVPPPGSTATVTAPGAVANKGIAPLVPPTNPTDSGMPVRGPGPSELYQTGRDQLTRGSSSTARALFQELLDKYPSSDDAPDAQYWIAESFARENNNAAADAAYAAVVSKYENAPKASTALYKRAMLYAKQGNNPKAKELFEQVIARYPRSDDAELSKDQLKLLR